MWVTPLADFSLALGGWLTVVRLKDLLLRDGGMFCLWNTRAAILRRKQNIPGARFVVWWVELLGGEPGYGEPWRTGLRCRGRLGVESAS